MGLDRREEPGLPDTLYVTELVVADTVNTMPEKTLRAFADHGEHDGDAVTGTAVGAQEVFDADRRRRASTSPTCSALENEGVDKFEQSWAELLETVKGQLDGAKG